MLYNIAIYFFISRLLIRFVRGDNCISEELMGVEGMEIEVKVITEASCDELIALYRGAGWWNEKTDDISWLPLLIRGSICFVGAFCEGRLIGMGRGIGDGISDAYIQDVTVLPEYRNKGIGGLIINKLVNALQDIGLKWIGLIGEPGTQTFYERLGFRVMKDYIPMMKKGEDQR